MNKLISVILSITMIMAITPTSLAEDEIKITYNGEVIETDTPPVIVDDRTLVPARAVFETMGMNVYWNEQDRVVRVDNILLDNDTGIKSGACLVVTMDSDKMEKEIYSYPITMSSIPRPIETAQISLDVPAQIINDRTMIPVRAVSEAMDITVDWDGETRTVVLTDEMDEPELTH